MKELAVKDVMTNLVVTLAPADSVHEAAERLSANRISGAPVVEGGRVIGMVSESDLIHAVSPPAPVNRPTSVLDALVLLASAHSRAQAHARTVGDIMSTVIVQASPEQSIWTAASLMDRRGVKRLPVVDEEGYLVGIVSRADLVRTMARSDEQVKADVMDGIRVLGEEVFKELSVDVEDGVVTLRGVADRKSTKRIAAGIAARTFGVVEVADRLSYEWDDDKAKLEAVPNDPRDPSARNLW